MSDNPKIPPPGTLHVNWKDHLNVIGLFIGTHGLAVFLVVYYTVVLYPRITAERKEWIEQITRLRQLVDPESRPVNRMQAETILRMVANSYMERLRLYLQIARIGDRDTGMSGSSGGDGHHSTYFWGQEFHWEDQSIGTAEQQELDLREQMSHFADASDQHRKRVQQAAEKAFDDARAAGEVMAYQLARIRIERGALDDIWRNAEAAMHDVWLKEITTISFDDEFMIDQFQKDVAKHPGYTSLISKERDLFKPLSISRKTPNQVIDALRNSLDREISKQLTFIAEGLNTDESQ